MSIMDNNSWEVDHVLKQLEKRIQDLERKTEHQENVMSSMVRIISRLEKEKEHE